MSLLDFLKGKRKTKEIEEYDREKHGELVEVPTAEGLIKHYAVNDPWAKARIREDPETGDRLYDVFEPSLDDGEKKALSLLKDLLIETINLDIGQFEQDGRRNHLKGRIDDLTREYEMGLNPKSREKIVYYILRDFQGYGIVDPLMRDERIEDISCDGPDSPVFIYHRNHGPLKTNITFDDEDEVESAVVRLAQRAGKHISIANPMIDATLPDGSRLQLSYGGKVTTRGSTFTIRKFRRIPFSPVELARYGTVSPRILAYLWLAIDAGNSVLFAGGTASGKTTTLNASSLFIPTESKVVSIEDTRELNLPHENWIPGLTRGGFKEGGEGEITMHDLLKSALRQRPDYLLVGEVRGREAYVLFQAMTTGHITLSTIHAESVDGVFRRLENPPLNVPFSLLESLDVVCVQVNMKVEGERARRFLQVAERAGVDYDAKNVLTKDVFTYNPESDDFDFHGSPRLFEEIAGKWSLSKSELEEEFERRKDVIERMMEENVTHYRDVWREIVKYRVKREGRVEKKSRKGKLTPLMKEYEEKTGERARGESGELTRAYKRWRRERRK